MSASGHNRRQPATYDGADKPSGGLVIAEDELRQNAILGVLPPAELDAIRTRAEVIDCQMRHQAFEPERPIQHVYFPLTAVFSMVATAAGDVSVEVATVGREGMLGLPVFLGASSSPHAAFCQVPGRAVQLGADGLRESLNRGGALHAALGKVTQATMVQIAQNVACNAAHSMEQRASRWLLSTQDRVGADVFPMTQDFLAQMLAVRRQTVSETASRLQDRGLISYSRGTMTIVDRPGLESAACECYQVVRQAFAV
jgi:CRP-like cAMP-binding protein